MNGGYIMIDCQGLDLLKGSTEQTITGIYAKVKEAEKTNKPIYAVNCTWGQTGRTSPINVITVDESENVVICSASTLQIVVRSTDVITINNLVGGGEAKSERKVTSK